jgi:hypothetical protein
VPITYERDDERRLITVTVTEPYTIDDILRAVDRQSAENTWGYAMLYDLRAQMTIPADLQPAADYVKAVAKGRARGPVGVAISGQPEEFRRGLKYTELARETVTVEVLLTSAQIDDWLVRNAPRRRQQNVSDGPFSSSKAQPAPAHKAKPGELLFTFFRASDGAAMSCILRPGVEFGVEALILERGELLCSRRFDTRALAVQWAEDERKALRRIAPADR